MPATSPGTTPESAPKGGLRVRLMRSLQPLLERLPGWSRVQKIRAHGRRIIGLWESVLDRVPGRRVLHELPWLGGIAAGWWICWRDGQAMVLDGRVSGYQWSDYMNNCWLVANRVTERYDSWRGIVHAGFCGTAGEALGSYPNGAILVASISVFMLIFAAGLAARALGGPWSGMLAAVTLAWVPTVAEASHWGNSTPVIAAGTALGLGFGAAAMRWPRLGLAAAAGAAACIAWAADKRGLLVLPGVCGMIVVAALCAPRMEEGKQGLVSVLRKLRDRLPEALRERLRPPARLNKPVGWMIVHQRKLLMIPALCLGLLIFPLRTAWLGETTNVEWERQMDAESMRQVHDGTARRWSQQARSTRSWSDWSWMDSNLDRIVPPFTAVIRSNRSTHGLDQDLMNRCKELAEDDFLVIPDFFYTDCSRATLAHNTRENLSQITALPLGLVWIAVPLCLLPGRQRWWQGLLSGGALIAAVSSMWLVMASLNVMPTRYLIQFTTGAALLIPVGIGRLIHTLLPRSVAWGVSGFVCLGLSSWAQSVDINQRSSEHTWSYNQGFLERYYDLTQTIAATMDPTDDFLDCSDRGMNIWFLPNYTRFGTPMLKVDDAGRCKQWISWAPEGNTRWMTISPGLKLRPQHGNGPPASLEPSLRSDPNWRLEFDDRGAGVQLWKREQ